MNDRERYHEGDWTRLDPETLGGIQGSERGVSPTCNQVPLFEPRF